MPLAATRAAIRPDAAQVGGGTDEEATLTELTPEALARRRRKLLSGFDRFSRKVATPLERQFKGGSAEILREARREYETLADEVPYKGNDGDLMKMNIVGPAQLLAVALVLRRRGHGSEEIGAWFENAFEFPGSWLPRWLIRAVFPLVRPLILSRVRASARASQERRHPDEFLWELVDGPGSAVAVNIQGCAVCQLYGKHDAMDVVPFICALDDKMSDQLGLGLRRTGTRALGAGHCDFRYDPGGEPLRLRDQYDI